MVQHNRIPKTITFVTLALVLLAPLTAEAGGVSVYPILANLCLKVNCSLQSFTRIDSITSTSNPTPGGIVVVVGQNFGSNPGALWLTGLNKYTGNIFTTVRLTVAPGDWHPTVIAGTIPHNALGIELIGLKDQPAKLSITTAQPAFQDSNKYPVNFKATQALLLLPGTDPHVKLGSCGTGASENICSTSGCATEWQASSTFCGKHKIGWASLKGDVYDSDTYQIELSKGWVLWSFSFQGATSDPSEVYVNPPAGFPHGGTTWTPEIQYKVNAYDTVLYRGLVYLLGPKGVPLWQ